MLKLTKYEFRKNMSAPAILLIVIGILEIVFLCCLAVGKESYVGLSFGIQSVVMMFSYFIILVLSISSYSRELKSKSSYMTFMAPVSTYKVIGSKLLTAFLTAAVFGIVLFILFPLNVILVGIKFDEVKNFADAVEQLMEFFGYHLTDIIVSGVMILVEIMVSFYLVVVLAYLAITLSSTVLQNKKFKGIVSFVLFGLIYFGLSWVSLKIPSVIDNPTGYVEAFLAEIPVLSFYLVCIVAGFFATGALLEKKVSL